MKPAPFDYHAPETIQGALELLDRHGSDARVIAGGQSLVPMLALRLARPEVLVDLNRIPELAGIRDCGGTIRIGAMTRQAHALASPLLRDRLPLLGYGLYNVGHPPTRARGTIGGSLSHADPAAETPAVMLAYDARMVLAGKSGTRTVDVADFTLGTFETCIEEGEILTEIVVDVPPAEGTAFVELSRSHAAERGRHLRFGPSRHRRCGARAAALRRRDRCADRTGRHRRSSARSGVADRP